MTARKPRSPAVNHKNGDPTDNLELTAQGLARFDLTEQPGGEYRAALRDGVATTIKHGDETIGHWRPSPEDWRYLVDLEHHGEPVWGGTRLDSYIAMQAPSASSGQRPYLLESALVEQELQRQRNAALGEIDAVEADMLAIETRANDEIQAIQARTDTELAARRARKDDLRKIVDMTGRALELDQPPLTNGDVQDALGQAIDKATETQGSYIRDTYGRKD